MTAVTSPDAGRPRRWGRRRHRHTVGAVIVTTLLIIGLVTAFGVAYSYRSFNDNLDVQGVNLGTDRPDPVDVEGPDKPLNILVMGSDAREGEGNNIDGLTEQENHSDTTILMHLSADRERAYGVSIPRDTLVDRPECETEDGERIPAAEDVMWNKAYSAGGPSCTITQFEAVTDIRVDHYVVVDFAGFKEMVDAVGGVEICIPEDIEDPEHGISLEAGTREVQGSTALDYVRERHGIGDGSDIGRMKRQQAFIASMTREVVSAGTLTRVDRLYRFLDAATQSLTVDPGLGELSRIASLGNEFRGIGLANIQFLTAPFTYAETDRNRLRLTPEAEELWRRIRNDQPLPEDESTLAISAARSPGGTASPGTSGSADPSGSGTPSAGVTSPGATTPGTESPSGSASPDEDELAEQARETREDAGLCV